MPRAFFGPLLPLFPLLPGGLGFGRLGPEALEQLLQPVRRDLQDLVVEFRCGVRSKGDHGLGRLLGRLLDQAAQLGGRRGGDEELEQEGSQDNGCRAVLDLAASIYPGFQPDGGFGAVLVGVGYGLVDGFIGGAVFAWVYNRFAGTGRQGPA